jgi:hypothetical protein
MKLTTSIGMIFTLLAGGCASYVAPGRGADLSVVGAPTAAEIGPGTDATIRQAFDKRPLASFPASIAVARVQAPGYRSYTAESFGTGRYSIVTTCDIEKPQQMQRLAGMPRVAGIGMINQLLLDGRLDSELPLRQAASKLRAEMLLIYTLDTKFTTDNKAVPLSVISLGLSPNEKVRVTTTAAAVLMDTRNGYVYGMADATEQQNRITNSWQNANTVDETRLATETAAFEKLVGELESTWKGVVATYDNSNSRQPAAAAQ